MKPNKFLPPAWRRPLAALAAVAIAAMLSSCAHLNPPAPEPEPEPAVVEKKPPPEPIKPPPPSSLYEWWGANEYLSHIEVNVNEQKARFYSGDKLVGWTTVASGIRKFPTPIGSFAVTEKVQNKKSNLYGKIYNKNGKLVRRGAKMGVHKIPAGGSFKGAPMPYFLRLTNDGIGMHAGPIPRPGNRASHGCIRMPKNFAPILYRHVDVGTSVTIKGNGPTYASYLAKQRKSAPKPKATAVAETKPAPASAVEAVPAATTTEPVSAAPHPATVQDAAAATTPVQPSAGIAASIPSAPAPTAPAMTGMGTDNPMVYATPLAAPPAVPKSPAPSVLNTPAASPQPPISAPARATAAPAPEAPQSPPQAPPADMTGVPSPNLPAQSSAPQAPAPAAVSPTVTSEN
jgi:hypothetical protein